MPKSESIRVDTMDRRICGVFSKKNYWRHEQMLLLLILLLLFFINIFNIYLYIKVFGRSDETTKAKNERGTKNKRKHELVCIKWIIISQKYIFEICASIVRWERYFFKCILKHFTIANGATHKHLSTNNRRGKKTNGNFTYLSYHNETNQYPTITLRWVTRKI